MAKDVKVQIVGDASKYKAALADAGSASDKFANKTKTNADQMSKFGLGALAVAGAVGVGMFKAAKSASSLGESVNAVRVTFGKSADGILELGENAADSLNLSNVAFNGLAVQFSNFAKTIAGSGGDVVATMKELTGRAGDFASVMDIDVREATTLFQSGLAGETEPLRRYGIDLSAAAVKAYAAANGIGTLGKELTEGEKVQARYALIMEKTSAMQDDLANTADSAANQMRHAGAEAENAAASLGEVLAPILATVAGKAADLVSGFVALNEKSGGAVVAFAGVAAAGIGLVGIVTSVIARVQKMREVLVAADGSLTGAGKAAKGLGIALGIAALAMFAHGQAVKNARERQEEFTESISELGRVADEELGRALFQTLANGFAQIGLDGKKASEMFDGIAQSNIEGARRALEWAEANGVAQVTIDGLTTAIAKEEAAVKQGAKTTEEFGETAGEAYDYAKLATDLLTGATEAAATAAARYTAQVDKTSLAVQSDIQAIGREWDTLTGNLTNEQAWIQLEQQAEDVKQANIDAGKAIREHGPGSPEAITALQDARLASIGLELATSDYAKEVAGLPPEVATRIAAAIGAGDIDKALADLQSAFDNTSFRVNAHLDNIIVDGETHAAGSVAGYSDIRVVPTVRRLASGTARVPGALGQPFPAILHGGEAVIPAGGNGGGGATINITVNAGLGTNGRDVGLQIAEELRKVQRTYGALGLS